MRDNTKDRCVSIARYIVSTGESILGISNIFEVSERTVRRDLNERLPEVDPLLAQRVKEVLRNEKNSIVNKAIRTAKRVDK